MEKGELSRRRREQALRLLNSGSERPHFTTTAALRLLDAECGTVKFHRFLVQRGLASPVEGQGTGHNFTLSTAFGYNGLSMDHTSFHWTPKGVEYMASILTEQGVAHGLPDALTRWCAARG